MLGVLTLAPGTVLDDAFVVGALKARGAQASVYVARPVHGDGRVALKYVSAQEGGFTQRVQRLGREHAMLEGLSGIGYFLKPLAFKASRTHAYIVIDWIDGAVDGGEYIRANGPLDFATWLWVAKHLTMAVFECHRRGYLHRDIKPRNTLISPPGVLKLIDFGIAEAPRYVSLSSDQVDLGTFAYLPPEQVSEGEVTSVGDIYALGVTLYEFLVSSNPFEADSPGEVMGLKAAGNFVPASKLCPEVPVWVDRLFERLLDPVPENRPQGAREVLSLLTVGHEAVVVGRASPELRSCSRCGEMLWRQLGFCTCCGQAYRYEVGSGSHAVRVLKNDDPKSFLQSIREKTGVTISDLRARLFHAPCPRILIEKIDETSAQFLATALASPKVVLKAESIDFKAKLSAARLPFLHVLVAGISLLALGHTLLSIPYNLYFKELTFMRLLFSQHCVQVLVCLGAICYLTAEALLPLLPRSVLSIRSRRRQWKVLVPIARRLSRLSDPRLRRKASALVRRVILVHDHIVGLEISSQHRRDMLATLAKLVIVGLERLLSMDGSSKALKKVQKAGLTRKRQALERTLERSTEAGAIKRLADRLAGLTRQEAAHREVERKHLADELLFSSILAEINSLHVSIGFFPQDRWQNELASSAKRFGIAQQSPGPIPGQKS